MIFRLYDEMTAFRILFSLSQSQISSGCALNFVAFVVLINPSAQKKDDLNHREEKA